MGIKWYEKEKVEHQAWQVLKTAAGLTYYYNRETKEVTWDCPPELANTDDVQASGEWFWIPDPKDLYLPAKKISSNVFQTQNGITVSLNPKKVKEYTFPLKTSSLERIVEDLVLLDDLHPPLILHNLKSRFESDKIYTYIGNILIAVNPYQPFPLYSNEMADGYQRALRNFEPKPPHVFKVADDAFRRLCNTNKSQSIIISGDSGSGKTEATKHCLRYLARISSTNLELSASVESAKSEENIETKILMTNPILEAFGNAKTIRNDNSSRFGKFIKIFFRESMQIEGASIDAYLLEKIRVVYQSENERNYHIFYQMLSQANANRPELRNCLLGNKSPSDFNYLGNSRDYEVPTINDAADFEETIQAMKLLEFSESLIMTILEITSAVLYLGNISLVSGRNDDSFVADDPRSKEGLRNAAKLLKVSEQALKEGMIKRKYKVSGRIATSDIRIEDALKARDALAKTVYARLFYKLVELVNKGIHSKNRVARGSEQELIIGVLDIFGFEIFEKNSLEQLCINYTNEKLQQLFNLTTFKQEEELYAAEGIPFESVGHWDNQGVINLIGGRPGGQMGLFLLLDEELKLPGGNTKDLFGKYKGLKDNNFRVSYNKAIGDTITVEHYAGRVEYDISEFLDKNNDTLLLNLLELVLSSSDNFLQECFSEDATVLKSSGSGGKLKRSVCTRFNTELRVLIDSLQRTGQHYIRCVKPNDLKAKNLFNPKRSYEQLLYAGVFEAVKIRKKGYPFNSLIQEFNNRYGVVFTEQSGLELRSNFKGKNGAVELIGKFRLNQENTKIGRTRVFYRSNEFRSLELRWSIVTEKSRINIALNDLCKKIEPVVDNNPSQNLLEDLVKYIFRAEELNFENDFTRKADQLYEKAVESRMDSRTKTLIEECLHSKDEAKIEKVLVLIDQNRYRTRKCVKLRELYRKLKEANYALKKAIEFVQRDLFEEAIAKAEEVPLNDNESTLFRDARIYLQNIVYLENTLSVLFERLQAGSTEGIKKEELIPLLERAKQIRYNSPAILKAKLLHERIDLIDKLAPKALELLYEDVMRTIVGSAKEINYNSSVVKQLSVKVNSDVSMLRKEQLKAAVSSNDLERQFWLTVEIQNEFIQNNMAMFHLDNFSLLVGASKWSTYKLFGRAELKQTYLNWTKKTIHHSLTLFDKAEKDMKKKLNCLAIKIHKMILIYMGDKPTTKKVDEKTALFFVLNAGVNYLDIRNEIYVQILKQINKNENPESSNRGYQLLKICLSAFPPTEDFQCVLEAFILRNIKQDKNTYLYILHYKSYHVEILQGIKRTEQKFITPSEEEVKKVIKSEYKSDIQEPLPHKILLDLKSLTLNFNVMFETEKQKLKRVKDYEEEEMVPLPPVDEVANKIEVPDVDQTDKRFASLVVPDIDGLLDEDDDDLPPEL